MASVQIIYYLDVLSSWCYIADLALERIEKKYGDRLHVDWRVALAFGDGPMPYGREKCAWFYARTKRICGVQLNPNWLDGPEATTLHANVAAEAARALGATGSVVRRAIARAALIDGKPMGRRERVIDEAARASGLTATDIDREMRERSILERIEMTGREFAKLALPQRPSFVMRNTSGDLAVLSGLYTLEALDSAIHEMLEASSVTEDFGPEPA